MTNRSLLDSLPAEWPDELLPEIRRRLRAARSGLVVLDDDPTGTQTVHDVPVLTEWSTDLLQAELERERPAFYVLTNSRSLPLAEARSLNAAIGHNLLAASRAAGRNVAVVSRSDSTLRGHFPGELEALADAMQNEADAWIIAPFFLEGGRYTIGDIHYVAEGDSLVPAGRTEFARDAAFGYRASNLCQWVEEKTHGRIRAADVASVSLDDVRRGGPQKIARDLARLPRGGVCVVNAVSYRDLEVFVLGLLDAEAAGRRFLYRTAASFVRVRAGIAPRPLLSAADLRVQGSAGVLFVVGSYVPRTTGQLEPLLHDANTAAVEVRVPDLLTAERRSDEIKRVVEQMNRHLGQGRDTVVYTSRQLTTASDPEQSLSIGRQISSALVTVVHGLEVRPRYLLAKGGITSSDLATKALGVKRANVPGQILPGVPVWQLGSESRFPGLAYIVFPGNVGGPDALTKIARTLTA